MFRYAQLDNDNTVIGLSDLSGEVLAENMILITDLEVELGSSYNRTTGKFILPESQQEPEPKASVEQITEETLLETKYHTFLLEMMM